MIRFFKKITKAIKLSRLLDEAWTAVAQNKVKKAEQCFNIIDKITSDLCAEHQIMKAYIKFKAEKYGEAKALYDGAWEKIDTEIELSQEEKLYFKGYISGPAEVTLNFLKYTNPSETDYINIKFFSLTKINLELVSKKWKVHFPLRDHPDWDKYGV